MVPFAAFMPFLSTFALPHISAPITPNIECPLLPSAVFHLCLLCYDCKGQGSCRIQIVQVRLSSLFWHKSRSMGA